TQRQLKRGERTVELLKQDLNQPLAVQDQISLLKINSEGLLDELDVDQIQEFEKEYLETVKVKFDAEMKAIADSGKLSDEFVEKLMGKAQKIVDQLKAADNSYSWRIFATYVTGLNPLKTPGRSHAP